MKRPYKPPPVRRQAEQVGTESRSGCPPGVGQPVDTAKAVQLGPVWDSRAPERWRLEAGADRQPRHLAFALLNTGGLSELSL